MTSNELEFFAECEHRSACARLVTLRAPMYTDDFEWCMCIECPYHDDRLGKNAKLRQQIADITESMWRMEERCAALRELVADMWVDMPKSKECRFDTSTGHCVGYKDCKGECQYWYRMRDLGVEVE